MLASAQEFAAAEQARIARDAAATPAQSAAVLGRAEDGSFTHEWRPNERRERVMYVEESAENGSIPQRTHELCKWDMQPISGTPFPYPVAYDERFKKFYVVGFTCSVSCALAYHHSTNSESFHTRNRARHIVLLAKDYFGASYSPALVRCAPPREKLSALYAKYATSGEPNPMVKAVAEFRQDSESLIFHTFPTPPFIRVTQRVDEELIRREREEQHRQRLELLQQNPRPIACTQRGREEQRKYVLARRNGALLPRRGTIDTLLGLQYRDEDEHLDDDDDDDDNDNDNNDDK